MKVKITYVLMTMPHITTWGHIIGPITDATKEELVELAENEIYNATNALYNAHCPYALSACYEVVE